jgi:AcrR family transcriptional regulator
VPPVSQRYRDARRRQVLDAARRCFAQAGFHSTSMQDVFAESGLSAGAVYGYFAGKDDLVAAIVEEVLAEVVAALDVVTESDPLPPLHAVAGRLLHALDDGAHEDGAHGGELARLAVQVWAEAGRNEELSARLAGYYREMRDRFAALVRHYQAVGAVDPAVDPHHVAQVLTALGPAFLSQRALLGDVSAASFTAGVAGLLSARPEPAAFDPRLRR